jgi:curved DNA-binding protein
MEGEDIEADLLVRIEEIMTGSTREVRLARPTADGRPGKETTIRVKIPKGIAGGQRIRCAGLGYPGSNGGPDGDLYLRVRLERHPLFKPDGHDLEGELVLAPWEVVLGASVTIPTPHGDVKMSVKPGTQPGTKLRLRGKGLPTGKDGYGDLYVTVAVEFPERVSEEEKALWESLAAKSGFRPRG